MKEEEKELTVWKEDLLDCENKFETLKKNTECNEALTQFDEVELKKNQKILERILIDKSKKGSENCRDQAPSIDIGDHGIFPFNSICLLVIEPDGTGLKIGTGFFISPKCVITAGHNVFKDGKWALKVTVFPGFRFGNSLALSQESKTFRALKGYTECEDNRYDYGAIILDDCSLYNSIGTFLDYSNRLPTNEIVNCGYKESSGENQVQFKNTGSFVEKTKKKLIYNFDTEEGNSGGPIYTISSENKPIVVGLHRGGKTRPGWRGCKSKKADDCLKEAIKVTERVKLKWNEWTYV